MKADTSSLPSIDLPVLTDVVRRSLQRENLQILNWRISQLGGGAGNPVSVGLYRCEGVGQDRDERMAWSVILKIIQSPANVGAINMGESDDQTHWNYWKRELLIYQSGLLDALPKGLTAPRCHGALELPGDIVWLWLEDISDSYQDSWSLERYALTARHLGRLNGAYPSEGKMPSFPWLSLYRTRQWISSFDWQSFPWEHPRVLTRYPRPAENPFLRLLVEKDLFLARLDALPMALCHGDTYPTNFMSRTLNGGREQTIALDWALAGINPIGDDMGQFIFGAQTNLKAAKRVEVDQTLFASYLDGLQDSGCRVDPLRVRFGYVVTAAYRVGLFQIYLLGEELKRKETTIEPAQESQDEIVCFEVAMANEAYQLLEAM
jgi:hypothetical protein